jgi:hypothetical protein
MVFFARHVLDWNNNGAPVAGAPVLSLILVVTAVRFRVQVGREKIRNTSLDMSERAVQPSVPASIQHEVEWLNLIAPAEALATRVGAGIQCPVATSHDQLNRDGVRACVNAK